MKSAQRLFAHKSKFLTAQAIAQWLIKQEPASGGTPAVADPSACSPSSRRFRSGLAKQADKFFTAAQNAIDSQPKCIE